MADPRIDTTHETTLDERVARALDQGDGADGDGAARRRSIDLGPADARPRRFGVRAEQDATRDRRLDQHELRLDALTNRLSGVALRLAALQAAAEGAETTRRDLSAELQDLVARVDELATDLHDVAATHELGTKVLGEARLAEAARLAELVAAREEDRARLEALEAAVAALTTKARAQAGQVTKLRNQLKAAAAAPAPDAAGATGGGRKGTSPATRPSPRGASGRTAGAEGRRRSS